MKRLLTFFVAILYFCISSGFVMRVHYCMGKVSKVKIEVAPKKMCACGKKETKGCCKTESKFVKLNDNHQATYADFHVAVPFHTIPSFYSFTNTTFTSQSNTRAFNNHSPPIIAAPHIYLLNCVFRI